MTLIVPLTLLSAPLDANCPGGGGVGGGGAGPGKPPDLNNPPFDPPKPPPERGDPPPSGKEPAPPLPPPPIGGVDPATTPRSRPTPGLDALTDTSWERWWALNRADVLPRVARQSEPTAAAYAHTLRAELRPAIDALIEALDDPESTVREAAAAVFAGFVTDYRNADVTAALRRRAQGHDPWLRDLCHLGLGLRRDAESAEAMRQVLRSKREVAVSRAFAALALISVGALTDGAELEQAAGNLDEAEVAGCVLLGLGQTRDARHLPLLLDAARRKGGSAVRLRRVRADAITALGKLGHPVAVEFLGGLLADREKVIARSAALALGGYRGSAPAAEWLRREGLSSGDAFVRAFAALSLGRIGEISAVPALARHSLEDEVAVKPFVLLGLGLTRHADAAALLADALRETPPTGRFGTAALAAGLLGAGDDAREPLRSALDDARAAATPACSALALGLVRDADSAARLRTRLWLDGTRVRPGFAEALALIEPEAQSARLLRAYAETPRSSRRQAIVEALAMCGGPVEGAALADLYRVVPPGDAALRVKLLTAMAVIANDRRPSAARGLLLHTYYLQPNVVLNHLAVLP